MDLKTTLLTNCTLLNPPTTFTVNIYMQIHTYILFLLSVLFQTLLLYLVLVLNWLYDALADFQIGLFMKRDFFNSFFRLVQFPLFFIFSTFNLSEVVLSCLSL